MSHTFYSNFVHCVFSTKDRRPTISPELQPRLWAYMGGIARKNGTTAVCVGGVEDHIHMLLIVPTHIAIADAVREIKAGSSRWIHETCPDLHTFAWQEGYGAFSIGVSQVKATVAYIKSQTEHHKKRNFQEEFLTFLKKHGIDSGEAPRDQSP